MVFISRSVVVGRKIRTTKVRKTIREIHREILLRERPEMA
jgi:hypothetical protein